MRKHNGMRPQDIVILLKMITESSEKSKQLTDLSQSLFISLSEVSESLNRSKQANLVDYSKKNVLKQNFLEFLEHGVKYVFPPKQGGMVRGIPTAHSHPFMKTFISSQIVYVWPDPMGEQIGLEVEPFYEKQVKAVRQDELLYKLLALIDVIRIGKVREINASTKELKRMLLYEQS